LPPVSLHLAFIVPEARLEKYSTSEVDGDDDNDDDDNIVVVSVPFPFPFPNISIRNGLDGPLAIDKSSVTTAVTCVVVVGVAGGVAGGVEVGRVAVVDVVIMLAVVAISSSAIAAAKRLLPSLVMNWLVCRDV